MNCSCNLPPVIPSQGLSEDTCPEPQEEFVFVCVHAFSCECLEPTGHPGLFLAVCLGF